MLCLKNHKFYLNCSFSTCPLFYIKLCNGFLRNTCLFICRQLISNCKLPRIVIRAKDEILRSRCLLLPKLLIVVGYYESLDYHVMEINNPRIDVIEMILSSLIDRSVW